MRYKIIAIIQARIGSTRLPAKVLLPLAGISVLEHTITRVKKAKEISEVMVATSMNRNDKVIVKFCEGFGTRVFCGSEEDVLDRFYQAALPLQPDHVVRITADCPMIDHRVIDAVIAKYFEAGADYASNTIEPTYPDGQDVEIFKMSSLEEARKNAKLISERAHVTPYIKTNPRIFKLFNVIYKTDLSKKRWTLDEEKDYDFLKVIFDNLYSANPVFGMEDVLRFLKDNPEIEKMNSGIVRNEGYLKSLKIDTVIKNG